MSDERSALDRLLDPEPPSGSWWEDPIDHWLYYWPGNAAYRWWARQARELAGNAADDVGRVATDAVGAAGQVVDAGIEALEPARDELGRQIAERSGLGRVAAVGVGVLALATAAYVEITFGPLRALGRALRR